MKSFPAPEILKNARPSSMLAAQDMDLGRGEGEGLGRSPGAGIPFSPAGQGGQGQESDQRECERGASDHGHSFTVTLDSITRRRRWAPGRRATPLCLTAAGPARWPGKGQFDTI